MYIIYEKIIYNVDVNEEYMESGYNEEIYFHEYVSIEEAIKSGDFSPQIIKQMRKGKTVAMKNLVRSGTTRTLKEEGVTFFCSNMT